LGKYMAAVDLSVIRAAVSQGDAARARGEYKPAVVHYVAAGMMGANDIGPAIDRSDPTGAAKSLTQRAWDMNGLLSTIDLNTTVDEGQAAQASKWITQMMQWYTAAAAYAKNPAAHADAITQMGKFVPISDILPQFGPVTPFVSQMTATPPPPPAPVYVAPRPAPVYAAPRPAPAPLRMAIAAPAPKKSFKSVVAAIALGVGGAMALGPVGAAAGLALGGLGSKFLLKW
jgi:hypothetical protein